MKKLLPCTALVMCAGMACAQAEERNDWHFNIGAMYEIENVEGYGEDMDGLAEPSVYFNAANGPWRIALAYYQEGPVDYSAGKRGTWFDRPELEVHYQFLENDRSEEHTSELQSRFDLVCRLLLEKKNKK